MEILDGYVEKEEEGVVTKDYLMTYSEEEKQANEINAANAKLLFTPKFVPFYFDVQKKHKLTDLETKLYGFIDFFLSNSSDRFYFSNEQIMDLMDVSVATIKRAFKKLKDEKLIKTSLRVGAGGGTIRFVTRAQSRGITSEPSEVSPVSLPYINNNKINNILLNNILPDESIETTQSGENLSVFGEKLIKSFNELFKREFRLSIGRKRKLAARLKTYTPEEIEKAMVNLSRSRFHQGQNQRGWKADPDFLLRNDEQIDKWLNFNPDFDNQSTGQKEDMLAFTRRLVARYDEVWKTKTENPDLYLPLVEKATRLGYGSKELGLAILHAHQDDYYSGRNGKWKGCNLGWILKINDQVDNVLKLSQLKPNKR